MSSRGHASSRWRHQIRCKKTEKKVRDRQLSHELLDDIGAAAVAEVKPQTSWRAAKDFRLHIIATLAHRVVKQAMINAGGTIH